MTTEAAEKRPHVGLFVTCLVDLFRPSVGFAAIKLLEEAGATRRGARRARPAADSQPTIPATGPTPRRSRGHVIETFERFDYVVAPSGSCAGMLRLHYTAAARGAIPIRRASRRARRQELRAHKLPRRGAREGHASMRALPATVTYHDSCSCLARAEDSRCAAALLASVDGPDPDRAWRRREVCCGFGGAFSVKYPDISNAIVEAKVRNIAKSGAA